MTMPQNEFAVSALIQVTVIYEPASGSPVELAGYGGKIVAVPPTYIPLPPRGKLFGVNGYSRVNGSGGWEWVLQGEVNPIDSFVDSLTGQGHWDLPASRADIKLLCQQLLNLGIPGTTITGRIPQIYASIAAEVRAEDAS
jgi:hypothetical protein